MIIVPREIGIQGSRPQSGRGYRAASASDAQQLRAVRRRRRHILSSRAQTDKIYTRRGRARHFFCPRGVVLGGERQSSFARAIDPFPSGASAPPPGIAREIRLRCGGDDGG